MMGGGAFILLKGGQAGPESTKRAKIRLAILLKILHYISCRQSDAIASPISKKRHGKVVFKAISAGYG
jgi:hypothetical protein